MVYSEYHTANHSNFCLSSADPQIRKSQNILITDSKPFRASMVTSGSLKNLCHSTLILTSTVEAVSREPSSHQSHHHPRIHLPRQSTISTFRSQSSSSDSSISSTRKLGRLLGRRTGVLGCTSGSCNSPCVVLSTLSKSKGG